MDISKKNYKKLADARAKKSPVAKNCVRAFLVGGAICCLAEGLKQLFMLAGTEKDDAGTITSVVLVFVASLLTGVGVFDKIAKFAGAGTLVPITGFANAVVSPAIDSKSEGLILGLGAKIFTVAGPVLLYGTLSGAIYGLIYWIAMLFVK